MKKVYQLEVGVLLRKDNEDYNAYNTAYGKQFAFYDESVSFLKDFKETLALANHYVNSGVNFTYAIISQVEVEEEVYNEMEDFESILDIEFCDYSLEGVKTSMVKIDKQIINDFLHKKEELKKYNI